MKLVVNIKDVLANFARWAVYQSPYNCPDNLAAVLSDLSTVLKLRHPEVVKGTGIMDVERADMEATLSGFIEQHPEVQAWNQRKNGDQSPYSFTSRYDGPGDPDADFIDLDALRMNVMRSLSWVSEVGVGRG